MRHLLGLLMVMAILAVTLIKPEISDSIQKQNQLALAACESFQAEGEKQNLRLDEVWVRCDPSMKTDNPLTAGLAAKIKISFKPN